MIDGIYHVTFSSSGAQVGEGLVTVNAGSVHGGDHGYLYLGHLTSSDGELNGRLHIKRWNSAVASIFGPRPSFDLDLAGRQDLMDRSFQVTGHVAGQQHLGITISGRFLSPLA